MAAMIKQQLMQNEADSMYALAGEKFKTNISESAFKVFARHIFQLGALQQSSFLDYSEGVSFYKLVFADATLKMSIGLDNAGKLKTFLFKSYIDPAAVKTVAVPSSNTLATNLDKKIDTVARAYILRENTVGLSIGILKNGQMKTYAYGSTAKGEEKLPDENTLFQIGSISKTFTSLLLAHYVSKNKMMLTDPVTRYLPDSVSANNALKDITLLHLSNHTSGLPRMPSNFDAGLSDPLNPYKDYDLGLIYSFLKECTLANTPREGVCIF